MHIRKKKRKNVFSLELPRAAGASALASRKGARWCREGEGEHEGIVELSVSTPRAGATTRQLKVGR